MAGRVGLLVRAGLFALPPAAASGGAAIAGGGSGLVAGSAVAACFAAALVQQWRAERTLRAIASIARRAAGARGDAPGGGAETAGPRPDARRSAAARAAEAEIGRLAQQVSERARLIETLLGAEEALVERLPDPLILLGADRSVRRVNGAAREMFGPELASVLRHPAVRGAIAEVLAGADGHRARVDVTLGAPIVHDLVASVIGLAPPLPGGGRILVTLSDRTGERAIERTRTDFIANASHELRTPLTSLIGFIETLAGPAADDPPARARFLPIMAAQAARMNRLIDGLLSLSRIEVSEHRAPQERVALAPLLARVAAGFEPRIASLGRVLEVAVAADLPEVRADADQLFQVVENLLDNACKHGREGGRITLSCRRDENGRGSVAIEVEDDGPGIARAHLPRLTERFYRVEASRGAGPPGTGLGLAIVKHVVNRHRGTLSIESVPGAFTRLRINLPIAARS